MLGDFDLESTAGTWTLFVVDVAGGDTGTLNNWALRIAPTAGDCPAPQLVHSFPLDGDPGWTRQGQWQFGQPTGGAHTTAIRRRLQRQRRIRLQPGGRLRQRHDADVLPDTTAIDCSNVIGTRLWFRRWLGWSLL